MPWKKLTYKEMVEIYKEIAYKAYNQRDEESIVRELILRGEILEYDLTKRQLVIISFIFTFSFNFGKEWAYIPKLIDFELAGISKTKIKSELEKLEEMNVIEWKREEYLFRIKSNEEWNVPFNSGYNDKRVIELVFLNMEHAGLDVVELIKRMKY